MPKCNNLWRSLVGYSPWGRKESDTTEVTEHTFTSLAYFQKNIFVRNLKQG